MADIPIIRHTKVKKDANPFDPAWVAYFEQQRQKWRVPYALFKRLGIPLSDWTLRCYRAGIISL